jgi:type IV pilus assembly protein PilC
MPRYRYSGKRIDGATVEGFTVASDRTDLEVHLMDQGIYLQSARLALNDWQQWLLRRFRASELTRVTRQLHILLQSKVTVVEALDLVVDQIKDRSLRSVFEGVLAQVESGRSLAESFRDYPVLFDDLYSSMAEAGESSGQLDFAFDNIASYREKREATTRKIRTAMAYPLLVIIVAMLVVFALVLYVVPVFSSMYENFNAELPALTRLIVGLSNIMRSYLVYILLAFVTVFVTGVWLSTTAGFQYRVHMMLVRTPLLRRLTIKIVTARFCRTMGTLLTSGVNILKALEIASKTTGNRFVSASLEPAGVQLVEGKSFTEAIASTGLFPKAVLKLSASGEKTGQLGPMLTRAADYYDSETDAEITTITSLIEPIIIIFLGVLVAFILIAMYLPLFDLVNAL